MKTRKSRSSLRWAVFLAAIVSLSSAWVVAQQSSSPSVSACPKIPKTQARTTAKQIATQRIQQGPATVSYSHIKGVDIPNFM